MIVVVQIILFSRSLSRSHDLLFYLYLRAVTATMYWWLHSFDKSIVPWALPHAIDVSENIIKIKFPSWCCSAWKFFSFWFSSSASFALQYVPYQLDGCFLPSFFLSAAHAHSSTHSILLLYSLYDFLNSTPKFIH